MTRAPLAHDFDSVEGLHDGSCEARPVQLQSFDAVTLSSQPCHELNEIQLLP